MAERQLALTGRRLGLASASAVATDTTLLAGAPGAASVIDGEAPRASVNMEVSTDDGEQGARGTLTAGDDESTVQCAGWTVVTRRGRPKERTPVSAADKQQAKPNAGKQAKGSNLTRAQFAQKVNRTFARTARMPRMPAETEKIIIRPRGGLAIREVEPLEFNRALATAAKIDLSAFRQDITYPNPGQNILVVSTPCLVRAQAYSNVRELNMRGKKYEVFAYRAAPDNTVKGIIYNISPTYTQADIKECVIHEGNPTAIEAHRIGESRAVVVLFEGQRIPRHVNFAGYMTRCRLYRQHREVCYTCGQIGHRKDVCPRPEIKVCFACGTANPEPDHEAACKPRCKLCGGPHASGTGSCPNKFKTPFVVRQREREHKIAQQKAETAKSKGRLFFPGGGEFPRLGDKQQKQEQQLGRSRKASRSQSRGKSRERERSHSRGRSTWAQMAAGKGRRITPENGADKMANGGNGKAPPASSNTDNEEIAELRGMVKQLIETVKKQGEMLERYRLASTQQKTTAPKEGTGWQLGNVQRPASLTPPWVGTTEPLQPLSKKMRKRAVETPAAVEDDSGMVDDAASVTSNADDERRPEDDGINYGTRIHKQGKRIDKVSNQVRSLCERMNGMEQGLTTLQQEFAEFKQFIKDQLAQVTRVVTELSTKHGQTV